MSRLVGKVALITGGSSGLGRAAALLFAREGAHVAIAARREEESAQVVRQIREMGGDAIYIKADVSRAGDCELAVARTVETFGKLDVAFNNAGVETHGHSVADTDEATWDHVLGVNLKGVFLSMKYEIPEMLKVGGGSIINMASIFGLVGSAFGASPYHASKHGVIGLTKAAALELAQQKIRVNAICPAVIATEMVERWLGGSGLDEQVSALHPVGRFGTPNEVAEAVLFLASDASSFITGTALTADGGYTAG
ncbi:short-chain dehydrogenase [Burkholderia ubonensis]|uniref:glucose 1-dehydrogenase n=1 Tax=Burkholderia ubonensis TaxID=101571 RepID=UPI000754491F|nr:glucose 1-dehydrogenase [Burkholderia ubonensis]KVU68314.1 short-chain dehydrogenase [Burkholderia ubonensis]OJB11895.1 short-chain dehydrogenase [Burkholderia ubonensis]OJB70230.1 short-chain dehydrogenase [Burkholderia ubonensis]